MTRTAARLASLTGGAASRLERVAGSSVAVQHSMELVTRYAWSERTESSRHSQWKAWVEFLSPKGNRNNS